MAILWDHRFKGAGFRDHEKASQGVKWLKEEIEASLMSQVEQPPPKKAKQKAKESSFWTSFDEEVQKKEKCSVGREGRAQS